MALSFVVGYQTTSTGEGDFTGFVQTFEKVDGSSFAIGDIAGTFSDEDMLQIIGLEGDLEGVYTYYDGYGWVDDEAESHNEDTIPFGFGVTIYTQAKTAITQSGAVAASDKNINIAVGFTATGNASPVDVKLGDIGFTGLNDEDTLQIIGTDGDLAAVYTYYDGYGWANDDGELVNDTVIKAGAMFFVSCAEGGAIMTIPSPIAK